ncbi:hypothetical protein GWK36_13815 [Caldichromatium japonicum]|uniref:Uncharacterized protein n=1 Tax=Caldichromatium japonicum TaxID=2699430 RepID=A0A6G7VG45_9GAMM|nr:hypothetical protein [Caldichromatium japonicum]QIK38880.1 hypothetical protein GWK36_13815 [Caldichromatium japonicum]
MEPDVPLDPPEDLIEPPTQGPSPWQQPLPASATKGFKGWGDEGGERLVPPLRETARPRDPLIRAAETAQRRPSPPPSSPPPSRNAKQLVAELLRQLPEDCTIEEIQWQLYALEKAQRGREDIAQGRGYLNSEAKQRLDRWLES